MHISECSPSKVELLSQILETETITNIYSGKRRDVAVPYKYEKWTPGKDGGTWKTIGTIIRIIPSVKRIITNPDYHVGSSLVCFVDEKYEGVGIISIKITKINPNSVNGEPVEFSPI
jgi:hypothetical protein